MELLSIAQTTENRIKEATRPIYSIRVFSTLAIGASFVGLWLILKHINTRWEFGTITEIFESADACFNLVVLLAGLLWFLFTLEARIKRKRVLGYISELREFAHLIDVTQLYYTPDLYESDPDSNRSSLKLDYTYLFLCTQMLAVISNLAPLYTKSASSDSIWRAASDVETLSNDIATKLVFKTDVVRMISNEGGK